MSLTRVTVPPVFADDWYSTCDGWSINNDDNREATKYVEVKRTKSSLTLDLGPKALDDLIARADYYLVEQFEWEYQGLVRSAKATLARLEKDGHAAKVRGGDGFMTWRRVEKKEQG